MDQNQEMVSVVPPRNKKIGLCLFIVPFVGLLGLLLLYGVSTAVVHSQVSVDTQRVVSTGALTILEKPDMRQQTMHFVNVGLGFLALLCFVGIFVGIPLGIYFLQKKQLFDATKYDPRSGKDEQSVVPPEIKKWSWGAFGLTFLWGIYHNLWIAFLSLIPLVNIVLAIYLGIKGNELAWKKASWQSVQSFHSSQKWWTIFGVIGGIFTILSIGMSLR